MVSRNTRKTLVELMCPGMNLKKAYTYLDDVVDHKQVIPFRRFAGSIGRTAQAKAFKTTKGELPIARRAT